MIVSDVAGPAGKDRMDVKRGDARNDVQGNPDKVRRRRK